ncbi:alpha/beta hydrolase [Halomarina halobia]|uniref:Alpha/beta hydrolase n=1 Tax=Halomarina halobia TaxID=3033386 RepID=A0ABD6AC75_9EURY
MRRDATFRSEGAEMSGWFYSPDSSPPWPLVVMAHGFSATKQMVTDRYAEVFDEAGMAVLLFDHRGFGESGGEPRQQINPWVQARGYRDAISFATTLDEVDPTRIALWGDSFSSGAALVVAALDDRIAALVVQVPALGEELPPDDLDESHCESMKQKVRSGSVEPAEDEIIGPMPVVWDDQDRRPSALKPVTAFRWFIAYGNRPGTNWTNEVTLVRPKRPVQWYPGLCATDVSCPAMFVVSPEDEMPRSTPIVARDAYERLAGPKKWVEIPGGHFGLLYYPSETFDQASSAQSQFLTENLLSQGE